MNSIFITAIEFQDARREFPIVFVRAGEPVNGRQEIAPLAVSASSRLQPVRQG